tara:strand:+ start:1122 stop:1382 length:261 start_codon:yes stop_codon:yes gene_type:complete
MTNVTKLHPNRLAEALHELWKMAERKEITFIEGLVEVDTGDYVEWKLVQEGEKSYDESHLLAQLGYQDLIKKSIVEDICEITNADD